METRHLGGLFPPRGSARPSRRSIARCWCGSSRMWCYGSWRLIRLPSSAPGGSNEVVLEQRSSIPATDLLAALAPALSRVRERGKTLSPDYLTDVLGVSCTTCRGWRHLLHANCESRDCRRASERIGSQPIPAVCASRR